MKTTTEDFKKELFNFYQECYAAELEKKDKLLERVNLASGFLTVFGGVLAYYITANECTHFRCIQLLFYIPFGLACLTTLASMVFVAISVAKGFGYAYIPKTTEIAEFVKSAEKINATVPESQQTNLQDAFIENLSKQYCEYAAINRNHNIIRSGYIFKSLQCAVATMFIVVATIPGFLILKRDFETKPTQVKIVNQIEVKSMSENQNKSDGNAASQQQTNQQPAKVITPVAQSQELQGVTPVAQIAKPVWPQGHIIIEANEAGGENTNIVRAVTPKPDQNPKKGE